MDLSPTPVHTSALPYLGRPPVSPHACKPSVANLRPPSVARRGTLHRPAHSPRHRPPTATRRMAGRDNLCAYPTEPHNDRRQDVWRGHTLLQHADVLRLPPSGKTCRSQLAHSLAAALIPPSLKPFMLCACHALACMGNKVHAHAWCHVLPHFIWGPGEETPLLGTAPLSGDSIMNTNPVRHSQRRISFAPVFALVMAYNHRLAPRLPPAATTLASTA